MHLLEFDIMLIDFSNVTIHVEKNWYACNALKLER